MPLAALTAHPRSQRIQRTQHPTPAPSRGAELSPSGIHQRDESLQELQQTHRRKGDALHNKSARPMPTPRDRPEDFRFHDDGLTATCPAGATLRSTGHVLTLPRGLRRQDDVASEHDCQPCQHRAQCLRHPERTPARKVSRVDKKVVDADDPSERMRRAIDTPQGRALYGRRMATVEPVQLARVREGGHAVAAVLSGAQHREAGGQWVEAGVIPQKGE